MEPSPDEMTVYRTLFSGESLVVLRESGANADLDPEYAKQLAPYHDAFVADTHKRFPTAETSTIESFFSRRQLPALLTPESDLGIRTVLLDENIANKLYPSMSQITRSPHLRTYGWFAFRRRYPRAHAVTYITRVGFNATKTQALVFIQESTGPDIGDEPRFTILLVQNNNVWTITKKAKDD